MEFTSLSKRFGFGSEFIKRVRLLYNDPIVGQLLQKPFIWIGHKAASSPFLFSLVIESLGEVKWVGMMSLVGVFVELFINLLSGSLKQRVGPKMQTLRAANVFN